MNKKTIILALISLSLALYYFNSSSLIVSLSTIQTELKFSANSIHWIINIFNLTLMSLVLIGGKLADYVGIRIIYFLGCVTYFVGSVLCATASREATLLIGRVFQGGGIAFLLPTIALLTTRSVQPEERGKFIGTYQGIASLFLPIGTFFGGFIVSYVSWRAIFIIQIGWSGLLVLFALFFFPKLESRKGVKFSILCSLLFSIGIISFITGLMQGNSWGWGSPEVLITIGCGILLLIGFFVWNSRSKIPFINFSLFRHHLAIGALLTVFIISGARMVIYFWAIMLQQGFSYSAAYVGTLLLFATVPAIVLSPVAGRLFNRIGPRSLIGLGLGCALISNILISIAAPLKSPTLLILALLFFGCSLPFCYTPSSTMLFNHTDEKFRGKIASVYQLASQMGITVIFAFLATVLTTVKAVATDAGYQHAGMIGFEWTMFLNSGFLIVYLIVFLNFTSKKKELV